MQHGNPGKTAKGRALFRVVVEVTHAFFEMRAAASRFGAVTAWGGSTLGVLRHLKEAGPLTVPQIARARPVARQHIQKLANELAAQGLVEFIDNPAHKRSKLLRLTPEGEARHDTLLAEMTKLVERVARGMDEAALKSTAETVSDFRIRLKAI